MVIVPVYSFLRSLKNRFLKRAKSSFPPPTTTIICSVVAGGEEQSQLVEGDVTAVDLDHLDPGAQYEVQVIAIIQNREGNPVSVRITTRESHLFYKSQLPSKAHKTLEKRRWMYCTIVVFSLYSWRCHPLSHTIHHSSTGSRGYPEFSAACLESFTGCHRVHSAMGRCIR